MAWENGRRADVSLGWLQLTLFTKAIYEDAVPLPAEFHFLPLDGLLRALPADIEGRVLLAVDCANERRIGPEPDAVERAELVVNVDHHHDNSRFGAVNLIVDDASSTAEIVRDILGALDVQLTPEIAEALYVGLVTDTGRFMYENTGPRAHEMAAELISDGVDAHAIYRRLYEGIPQGKLELLARGLSNVERFDGGLLTLTHLTREDYRSTGADESYSEGVVDHLRSVEGTAVAGLVRDQLSDGAPKRFGEPQ